MASVNFSIQDYISLIPMLEQSSQNYMWFSYDDEADVMYINFKKPAFATDSELLDNDIILRYENKEIIGITILHAKERLKKR
jgi:uncharacterized protein YuzE